jgi:hypothetical protein
MVFKQDVLDADCARLSSKFYGLAADSQLWKRAYYERFVRPRAARIRGTPYAHLSYSSKLSNWLDDENLVKRGTATNWKRQYKLRHNWTRGSCNVSHIQVAEERPVPPLLVVLHDGIVYTSDSISGLKAWSSKSEKKQLAAARHKAQIPPTSLVVDTSESDSSVHRLVVGFKNGSFTIYSYSKVLNAFEVEYEHQPSSNGMLLGLACHFPFLITMTATQIFSIYKLSKSKDNNKLAPPLLLHSLRSQTVWSPVSLSVRPTSSKTVLATIAYCIPTILNWAVGVQELRLDLNSGELLTSRMATSPSGAGITLGSTLSPPSNSSPPTRSSSPFPATGAFSAAAPGFSKPTSLSYTHPYLLLSHPDNTLTTFLVTSTADVLNVSVGTRLWGHTSSVSGVHVEGRGKAVSVTERGEEMRIWELEGSAGRRRAMYPNGNERGWASSVKVTPGRRKKKAIDHEANGRPDDEEDGVIRGWVGFDDDSVVILKERVAGTQDLLVYDFS